MDTRRRSLTDWRRRSGARHAVQRDQRETAKYTQSRSGYEVCVFFSLSCHDFDSSLPFYEKVVGKLKVPVGREESRRRFALLIDCEKD